MDLYEKFKDSKSKNPLISSFVCLSQTLANNGVKDNQIERMLDRLVPKSDRIGCPKSQILKHLKNRAKVI